MNDHITKMIEEEDDSVGGWCGATDCIVDCRTCALFCDNSQEGGEEDGLFQEQDD